MKGEHEVFRSSRAFSSLSSDFSPPRTASLTSARPV